LLIHLTRHRMSQTSLLLKYHQEKLRDDSLDDMLA
jgi:hypothetical protein